jgi:hypothetical protein
VASFAHPETLMRRWFTTCYKRNTVLIECDGNHDSFTDAAAVIADVLKFSKKKWAQSF